jgi:hypothetical protein
MDSHRLAMNLDYKTDSWSCFEIVPVLAEHNGTTQMTQGTYETLLKGVNLTAK